MYEKILKNLEGVLERFTTGELDEKDRFADTLDLIIKIKTIQAMDVSAELIRESRRISRNWSMEITAKFIKKAVDILKKNKVEAPPYYLYLSKYDKNKIKYCEEAGYEKEIEGNTVIFKIDKYII